MANMERKNQPFTESKKLAKHLSVNSSANNKAKAPQMNMTGKAKRC